MVVAMLLVLNPFHWHLYHSWWLPAVALCLDILLADPRFPPHPVRGIGKIIKAIEIPLLKIKHRKVRLFLGLQVALLLPMAVLWIVAFFMALPRPVGIFFGVYLSYAGLALGSLLREGAKALKAIEEGTLEEARKAVSMLVSRDVSQMDANELRRSLAESLSENFCDAFVAPFLWLVLTGPPGLWAYKTISTLDSMWGYKVEPWTHIGRASAKMEDLLSFIPARLSAFFLAVSAKLLDLPLNMAAWKQALSQAKSMESPNSGYSMAVAAWAHKGAMGGPTPYHGVIKNKPALGPVAAYPAEVPDYLWTAEKIRALLRHLKMAGAVAGMMLCGLGVLGLAIRTLTA